VFSFRLGRATAVVEFRSEAARIDINEAPKELMAALFMVVGAAPQDAAGYADRIVGWRTPPRNNTQNSEAMLYHAAGLNYRPRGAPFEHVAELGLVLGVPPEMIERINPFITIFNGSQIVNLRDADAEVIAALAAAGQDRPSSVSGNATAATQPTGSQPAGQGVAPRPPAPSNQSAAVRILAGFNFDNGRRRAAEVVMLLTEGIDEPYRVLSWRDDAGTASHSTISNRARP
jgi:general secretion pathway protein K